MPKLKTKKGVAKRFRLTKSGKIKHRSSFRGHLLSGRAKNRKRGLRRGNILSGHADIKSIKRQLPYG
ncbi:MAG: 50S ribosomal protein L35 [Candidatus Omnitrophota bacterium]|nr:50S ribosomal protein L35 [Candidatus Omnitrophota bacterium]